MITLATYGCSFRRRQPWLSVAWFLRFRAARALRGTFAPVMRRPVLLERHNMSTSGCGRLVRDDPVCVPSPATAYQAVRELAGAVVYDCRPRILPVSIRLQYFRRPSGVRLAASSNLTTPPAEEAPVFRNSVPERAATPEFAAILSDDSGTDLEDELLHVSLLLTIVSPLQDPDTALPVSPSRYPAPPVPALPDPAPTSQLSPVPLRVVNELPTIDLFPSFTMSPAHSYYALATSPITTDVHDTSEYLSPGSV